MMESIASLFNTFSATSQAAIIASIVTLLGSTLTAAIAFTGVLITHRGNERRFALQLENDRAQKRTDREMQLRREIFIEASEGIDAGASAIYSFINLEKQTDDLLKKYSEKRSAISKVHLVAKEATVNLVMEFDNNLGREIIRLSILRAQLTNIKSQIKLLDDNILASSTERDRMIELSKQLNFDGIPSSNHKWDFVNKTFEYEKQNVTKFITEKSALEIQLRADFSKFAKECFATADKIQEYLPPLVKAVREELDLPFNYETYVATFNDNRKLQQAILDDFIKVL